MRELGQPSPVQPLEFGQLTVEVVPQWRRLYLAHDYPDRTAGVYHHFADIHAGGDDSTHRPGDVGLLESVRPAAYRLRSRNRFAAEQSL